MSTTRPLSCRRIRRYRSRRLESPPPAQSKAVVRIPWDWRFEGISLSLWPFLAPKPLLAVFGVSFTILIGLLPTPLKHCSVFSQEDKKGFSFERQFLSPLVGVAAGRNARIA